MRYFIFLILYAVGVKAANVQSFLPSLSPDQENEDKSVEETNEATKPNESINADNLEERRAEIAHDPREDGRVFTVEDMDYEQKKKICAQFNAYSAKDSEEMWNGHSNYGQHRGNGYYAKKEGECEEKYCALKKVLSATQRAVLSFKHKSLKLEKKSQGLARKLEVCTGSGGLCKPGWTRFVNSCYKIVFKKLSWESAVNNCHREGGQLISIRNKEEDMYIRRIANGVPVWIGGFKNNYDRWQWKNGDLWKYEAWAFGSPRMMSPNRKYISSTEKGWIDEESSAEAFGYVCQDGRSYQPKIYETTPKELYPKKKRPAEYYGTNSAAGGGGFESYEYHEAGYRQAKLVDDKNDDESEGNKEEIKEEENQERAEAAEQGEEAEQKASGEERTEELIKLMEEEEEKEEERAKQEEKTKEENEGGIDLKEGDDATESEDRSYQDQDEGKGQKADIEEEAIEEEKAEDKEGEVQETEEEVNEEDSAEIEEKTRDEEAEEELEIAEYKDVYDAAEFENYSESNMDDGLENNYDWSTLMRMLNLY